MSGQILSVIVVLLVNILPYFGITVDSASLENAIQTIVAIVAGLVIWYKRTQLRKIESGEQSDVTPLGVRR